MNDFTCDKCKNIFHKGWSDEEAEREFYEAAWSLPKGDSRAVVCDNCFEEFKIWFDSLTPEQHKRIRNE